MGKIDNILAVRNDRFGEFILNIPALRALKETYPQARLTLAVNASVKDLAECVECIDEVVVWDEDFFKTIKRRKFNLGIALNPTKEAHWYFFAGGIPVRVGYDRKWGFLLTHKLKDTKALGDRHEVECNLELAGLVAAKVSDKTPLIKIKDEPLPGIAVKTAIAIHPFTSDPVKQWSIERFSEFAKMISKDAGIKVVLVGKAESESEKSFAKSLEDSGILSLIDRTSLVELAQVLKQCRLLVSGDSGPVHLACAVNTPVLALFRNDLIGKTAKRWGPWGKGSAVIEKPGLNDITVDEVFKKVKEMYR